ncbi:MAG: HisA/HisF-related TIM barrel protein [Deltaproteobacteria bacterium]
MMIIPAIDIMKGQVVRLARGKFEKATVYERSPVDYARQWVQEGAELIHVVDLDGARDGEPRNQAVIQQLVREVKVPLEVGGGIRTLETIRAYLETGVARVVLSTKIIEDASFLLSREVKDVLGQVALSIDIKHLTSAELITGGTGGWAEEGDMLIDVPSLIQSVTQAGLTHLNFSDISRDGMLQGPDPEKILRFLKVVRGAAAGQLVISYAGGIGSLADVKALKALGAEGVDAIVVGRALYENKFTLKDAIAAAKL